MDRATDRIEQQIDRERAVLRSNLEQLEDRVRSIVDWRRQFRSNPALWIGCAFGGALLIALATGRPAEGRPRLALQRETEPPAGYPDHRRREISLAWRTIESALIGVAAAKLKDTLSHLLPGFREQLARRDGGYVHDPANDSIQH
jgi:hypothetical protein